MHFPLWCFLTIIQIPKRVNWDQHIPQGTDQWKWQMAVSKLFEERPIWPRSSINERLCNDGLKFGEHMLKRYTLLLSCCLVILLKFVWHEYVGLYIYMYCLWLITLLFNAIWRAGSCSGVHTTLEVDHSIGSGSEKVMTLVRILNLACKIAYYNLTFCWYIV